MTKPKILILQHRMGNGGVSYTLANIIRRIGKSVEITLCVLYDDNLNCRMDLVPSYVNVEFYEKDLDKVLNGKWDTAISFMPEYSNLLKDISANRKIVWVHGDYSFGDHSDLYSKLEYADTIVAFTSRSIEGIEKYLSKSKQYKKLVTSPFVDYDKIRSMSVKPLELKTSPKKFTIVTVARLSPEKGVDRCIEAAEKIKEKYFIDFIWYVIGEGPEKEKLLNAINEKGLNKNFKLIGFRNNPYQYIKIANVCINVSRHEGYCLALQEALVLRKPSIVTNFSGALEQLGTSNKYGIIIDPYNTGILAEYINDIHKNEIKFKFQNRIGWRLHYAMLNRKIKKQIINLIL